MLSGAPADSRRNRLDGDVMSHTEERRDEAPARTYDADLEQRRRDHRRPAITQVVEAEAIRRRLTQREIDILALIARGHSNGKIAEDLHFALGTIKAHIRVILTVLDCDSRTAAAVHAVRIGLIP